MSIILRQETNRSILAVWKLEESIEDLIKLDAAQAYLNDLNQFTSNSRKLEWLAVRLLLAELIGEHKSIAYKPNGQPYITDQTFQISISHTKGFVAILLAKEKCLGIDIEYISDRIGRIASRVFSPDELKFVSGPESLKHLTLMWCAKETLFKAFELSNVDFIDHLKIHPFYIKESTGDLIGQELQTKDQECLNISYIIREDFILTYGQKKCPDEFTSAGHSK